MPLDIANKLGSAIYTWAAILLVLGGGLWNAFEAHDGIGDNSAEIEKIFIEFDNVREDVRKDQAIQAQRSDKRDQRYQETVKEFKQMSLIYQRKLDNALERISYLEGVLKDYKQNKD